MYLYIGGDIDVNPLPVDRERRLLRRGNSLGSLNYFNIGGTICPFSFTLYIYMVCVCVCV